MRPSELQVERTHDRDRCNVLLAESFTVRRLSEVNSRRSNDGGVPPPIRVLVVDDDENFRIYLPALLKRFGAVVQGVPDGEAAITLLSRGVPFDLLVIDYEMPRLNGMQTLARVRTLESAREIYAVMLTSRDDLETKIASLNAGFDDFLSKGATEVEIMARMVAARRIVMRQHAADLTVNELYTMATRDDLTGTFNRRFFFEEAEHLLRTQAQLAVILMDLDDFKKINNTYGDLVGDKVLRDVGAMLLRVTRYEDFVARYGGDEFVMVVHELSPEGSTYIAERLQNELLKMQWAAADDEFRMSMSFGVAHTDFLSERSLSSLLAASDHDLYKSKFLRRHPSAQEKEVEDFSNPAEIVSFPEPAAEKKKIVKDEPSR